MDRRAPPFGLLLFLWAATVVGAYYVYHKPFSASLLIGFAPLMLVAGMLALAHVLGSGAIALMLSNRIQAVSARGQLALKVGIGLGLLGFIQLGLAALGVLSTWIAWGAVLIAILILVWRGLWREWRAVWAWPEGHRPTQGLAAFCVLVLGVALLNALAPPTAWDALVYHLTGPKWYLEAGRLTHGRDLAYVGFPQWGEMLFTWAMLMGSERAAAAIHWAFAPLTLMLLPDLLKPIAPGRAWLAAALLLSTTTLGMLAGWAYVEWMLLFAVTASALAILCAGDTGEARWLIVAGIMAGLAFGAKYTAAGAMIGLSVAVIIESRPIHDPRSAIRNGALFAVAVFITILPWLVKDWALTGNPVYPFFLPGKFWDSARAFWYGRGGTGLPLSRLLIAPWEMTVRGMEGFDGYEATIGPLWLALLPMLAFGWAQRPPVARRRLATILIVIGIAYATWLAQVGWSGLLGQTRLLFGVFPLLACVCAAAIAPPVANLGAGKGSERVNLRWLMGAVIAVVLTLSSVEWGQWLLNGSLWPVITGAQSERDYVRARLGWYAVAIEKINALPGGSRVMFLWEPRSYHCAAHVVCEPDALLDRWWHLRQLGQGADSVAAEWRADGVTHVLVFEAGRVVIEKAGFDPFNRSDWDELAKFRSRLRLVEDFGGAYQLYETMNDE